LFETKPANPKKSKKLKAITSKFDITAVAIPSRMQLLQQLLQSFFFKLLFQKLAGRALVALLQFFI
jgi:hypothetical protein